jgi:uncharacterized membrane protein
MAKRSLTRRATGTKQPARRGDAGMLAARRPSDARRSARAPRDARDAGHVHGAGAQAPQAAARSPRIEGLDALRGLAIVAMVVYHFCFDLRYFGLARWDFEHDWRWLTARTLILSSFLLIAGISAVLGARGHDLAHWLRHVGVIAAAALLVTAGSYLMFPQSFIWFGVLHAIAVSLLLARPLIARPRLAALVGVVVIVAGATLAHPAFDNRVLGFIGFMTHKPTTEDYVPLFPWMGVLLLGIAAGHALVRAGFAPLTPLGRLPAVLRTMGRHSLVIYLVHQPVMIGALWLAVRG